MAERGDFTDQLGNRVASVPALRIVTLAPDVTELVFAVGGGGAVVAVSTASDYPPAAERCPTVAPRDIESILAFDPDLVLATTAGNDPTIVERLRQLHINTATLDVTSFVRLEEACSTVGRLVGQPARAHELADSLHRRWTAARRRAAALPRSTGLYVVWWDPLIVAGPGTFHDDLLVQAGIDNRIPRGGGRYPRVDPEILLDGEISTVVAPDEPEVREGFGRVERTRVGARLASGKITLIWLPGDAANRPGPRLVEALEALVEARRCTP